MNKIKLENKDVKTGQQSKRELREQRKQAKRMKKIKRSRGWQSQAMALYRILSEAMEQIKGAKVVREVEVEFVQEGQENVENPKTYIAKEEQVDWEATVKLQKSLAEIALNTAVQIEVSE